MSAITELDVGSCPAPDPIEQSLANDISLDEDRVKDALHRGENVILANQTGLHPDFDRSGFFVQLNHRKQLDRISELLGKFDILNANALDALDIDLVTRDPSIRN